MVQRPTTLDCAALRGADSGGSAICEERCPYQEQTMPLLTELDIYLGVVFYKYFSPNGLTPLRPATARFE